MSDRPQSYQSETDAEAIKRICETHGYEVTIHHDSERIIQAERIKKAKRITDLFYRAVFQVNPLPRIPFPPGDWRMEK